MILKKSINLTSIFTIMMSSLGGLLISEDIATTTPSQQSIEHNYNPNLLDKSLQANNQDTPVSPYAEAELPFIGTRYFNFWGGNGTGQSITLEEDGTMIIKLHGTANSSVQYHGFFSNPVILDNRQRLLLKEDKIYLLADNGDIAQGCNGDTKPCESGLFTPSTSSIIEGFYVLGGTDQGLEVSGQQYRYYDEMGNQAWKPISALTSISEGVVYDGELYWCIPPKSEPGVCTESGWKSVAESLTETSTISESELSLAGLLLGDEESKVTSQFGQPNNRFVNPISTQLEYEGLIIELDEFQRIMGMKSTSALYCTPQAICPGMDFSIVRNLYGSPVISDREDGRFMEYYIANSSCWLKIAVNQEVIKSVEVACQP